MPLSLEIRDPFEGLPLRCDSEIAQQSRKRIYKHMLKTRGTKYRLLVTAMKSMKFVPGQSTHAELLESIYTFMRYIDDVVDGDAPLPKGYSSSAEYTKRKMAFAKDYKDPRDPADHLLTYCRSLAEHIGEDFSAETNDMLTSLHFDALRRSPGDPWIVPRSVLQHYFHLLDIRGTIGACLKLRRETHVQPTDIQPLGDASRISYTLEDFDQDIQAGYSNIPLEDMREFGIHKKELHSSSVRVREWMKSEAKRGMDLLKQHRERLPTLSVGWLSKAAFAWIYERPARNCFESILKNNP